MPFLSLSLLSLSLSLSFSIRDEERSSSLLNQIVPAAGAAVGGLLGACWGAAGGARVKGGAEAEQNAVGEAAVLDQEAVRIDGDVWAPLVKVI